MGLLSFMAALIFFMGAVDMNSAPAYAAVDMPGAAPGMTAEMKGFAEDGFLENEIDAVPALGFNEMMLIREKIRDIKPQGRPMYPARTFISAGDKAFFVGNTRFSLMDSFSEVFGYNETKNFRYTSSGLSPKSFEDEYSSSDTSREVSKAEFINTLKLGLHQFLKIDPKYNPFLWRQLLNAKLGDYTMGLDARIGSTMYVSPKVSWTQSIMGMPFVTELKWVPILKTTNSNTSNKKNYVMCKCSFKF